MSVDKIKSVDVRLICVPLAKPVSDAKVIQGKQTPLKEVMITVATIITEDGREGIGYTYCKRFGGHYKPYAFLQIFSLKPNHLS